MLDNSAYLWYNKDTETRRKIMELTYENYLVCLGLYLLYEDGTLDIKQFEDALATQFGGKENYEKILKNFKKTLDKKHE